MANLTQLKMLEDLDAFLLVDKPAGISFSTVVKTVKRKFNLVKVGHGGSLDAAASGLLVLLINDANKFVGDVMGADRAYAGTMRLGVVTDTNDLQGRPLAAPGPIPGEAELQSRIAANLGEFRGDVFQTEPRHCSVRREGTSGYDVADTGEHKPFLAHVYRFDVAGLPAENGVARLSYSLTATKGLLVRALVNDFGAALGCGAALETCRRERVGKFTVQEAVPFERLLEAELKDLPGLVMSLGQALAKA